VNVKLFSGLVVHRHFDQIRKRTVAEQPVLETDPDMYADCSPKTDESNTSGTDSESIAGGPDSQTIVAL